MRYLLLAASVVVAVSGCGSSAGDLEEYLAAEWSFDRDYSAVEDAEITVEDGNVEVATDLYTEATQAQRICDWVSVWVYGRGNGAQDSTVRILNREGNVLSQRQHENDVCSFG